MSETPTAVPEPGAPDAAVTGQTRRRIIPSPHRGRPRPLRRLSRALRVLGPGLITGAADDDPSGIGTYSQAGAAFGTGLLWLALYLLPLAIGVQEMCGRIGLVTNKGIAGVLRDSYSRPLLFIAVGLLFIANTINVGADLGAMAASVQMLAPGIPFIPILVIFAVGILLLEIFIPYRHYARILKLLTLSLAAYLITAIIVQPDWSALLLATIVPQIQFTPAYFALVVAVIGTTISPYLFFWQASEEVEEKEKLHRHHNGKDAMRQERSLKGQLRRLRLDTALGMGAAAITFWFIVTTTSATLHANGITNITSASEAARALEPLVQTFPNAGKIAQIIFAVGVIGTGLLAVPVLAGASAYGVAEAFGWREGLARPLFQARGFYGVIALSTLVGMALNLFGVNPIQALVYAALLNGLVAVPLLALILLVANNRRVMGEHSNGWLSNVMGVVTLAALSAAGAVAVFSLWSG
ncbi:MAG TPA: Nramp family divalent metal transporter [Ktedonobacterales bacterium]|jgi:NRAMP (natural resistance-associated macrophage protein)-like metal ion transporter|nr:Nramp family divalent metal transporter [Ktedonobacterales bacterium]